MIKDYIEYNDKKYQLSTIYNDYEFKTMIFPIENGVVSGAEVYKFTTFNSSESKKKHRDIYENPEKYISNEAIKRYLESKEEIKEQSKKEEKYLVLIDSKEFQQRVLDCITTEEIDKFFHNTVFADDERCKQAMIHGMCIASMLTSYCEPMLIKCK